MSTKLGWSKAGLKLSFDVSAQASPRVQQAYPLPDVAVLKAQMLNVALETVAQTGRTGIRITSRGTSGFPGTPGAVFSIIHTAVQAEITSTDEIRISGRTVNLLLDQAMPQAVHSFALRRVDAGQTVTWPVVSITTSEDFTFTQIADAKAAAAGAEYMASMAQTEARQATLALEDLTSDNILSLSEKGTVLTDWTTLTREQAGIDANATTAGLTAEKAAYDAAILALNTYLATLKTPTPWNSLAGSTTIDGDTFRTKFTDVYGARQTVINAMVAKARSLASAAQDTATAAATTAASAQTAASNASTDAASAISQLKDLASDNILSAVEKPAVISDYAVLINEQAGIDAQATTYVITTEKAAYDAAITALGTYLGSLSTPTAWNALTGDTTIVGTTFRAKFAGAYGTRQTLLNAIATKAKALVTSAQSTADSASTAASTAQSTADTATASAATAQANALAAQQMAGQQIKPFLFWDFKGTALPSGWAFSGGAAQVAASENGEALRLTSAAADPILQITGLSLDPAKSYVLAARVKTITIGQWDGNAYYGNPGHGASGSYGKGTTPPPLGQWTTLVWDFRSPASVGADFLNGGLINYFRMDFGNLIGDVVDVDWVAVGTFGAVTQTDVDTAQATATAAASVAATATIPTVVGDGATTKFLYVGPAITRTDWQGTQKLYSVARTNYLLYSQAIGQSGYYTLTTATLTAGVADPAGGTNAYTLTATAGSGRVSQYTPTVPVGNYNSSVWIRRRTGTGRVSIMSPTNWVYLPGITNTWVRYDASAAVASGGAAWGVALETPGDAVDIAFGQVEPGASVSSYIGPTTTAAITVTDYTTASGLATLAVPPLVGAILRGLATNAAASATSALNDLAKIAAEGWLTRGEKPQIIREWQATENEYTDLSLEAVAAGLDAMAGTYNWAATDTAGNTSTFRGAKFVLDWMLGTKITSAMDTSVDSVIWDPSYWGNVWASYYGQRTKLQNAIAQVSLNAAASALAATPKLVTTIGAVTPPASFGYGAGNLVMDSSTKFLWQCNTTNGWFQPSVPANLLVGTLTAGIVGAAALAAQIALLGDIRSSNPAYLPSSLGSGPTGFRISGVPFTTTYADGSTDSTCQMELGGSANFGGSKVSVINNKTSYKATEYKTPGSFLYVVPEGVKRLRITVTGGGGGGGAGSTNVGGGGGGAGAGTVIGWVDVTPGSTINVVVGTGGVGGTASNSTGGAGTISSVVTVDFGLSSEGGKGGSGGTAMTGGSGGLAVCLWRRIAGSLGGVAPRGNGADGADVSIFGQSWVGQGGGGGAGTTISVAMGIYGVGGGAYNATDLLVGGNGGFGVGSGGGGGASFYSSGGVGGLGNGGSITKGGTPTGYGAGGGGGSCSSAGFGAGGNGGSGRVLIESGVI